MNPHFLFLPLARRFSSKGAHDKALYLSGLSNVRILTRAGMWLTAMERKDCPLPARLKGLLLLGEYNTFWHMAERNPISLAEADVFGLLARLNPARTAELLGLPNTLRQYCEVAQGRGAGSEYSPYVRWLAAAQRRDLPGINICLSQIFSAYRLTQPQLVRNGTTFCIACAPTRQYAGGAQQFPQISVIMTAHDEAPRVGMAIDSLLAQTYGNFELLVVDDASTDGTSSVIRERSTRDSRIIPIALHANAGTFAAKNIALTRASGKYVMMHDADDWSHPERLRIMLTALDVYHCQAVSSRIIRADETTGTPVADDVRNFCRWNPSSFLYRRDFFERHGGYLNLLGGDCEFVARHEMLHGVKAHARLKLPLSIGLSKPQSLSRKFRGNNGGRRRLEDWEAWRLRHVNYIGQNMRLLWKT
jgi:hypothetical protein